LEELLRKKQNNMKKICILTSVHHAFNVRIFHKEAKSLVDFGYDVTLIAQHNGNDIVDGVKIIALPKIINRFKRIFYLTWQTLFLGLRQRADIYHFHDPELIPIGIILRFLGKKVIYDVHEDVPKQILDKEWIGNVNIRKFIAFIVNTIEHIGTFFFNKIVAATPDIARKFPKNKTIILRNFPILKLIYNTVTIDYKKNKSIITYAGVLTRIRGIKEIVQAMEHISDDAELWLLGKWENEKFKEECKKLKGWKHIKYLGFKKLEEVYRLMKMADIGVFLIYPEKRHKMGLPTKAFEYMACSLPMVLSDFPYRREVFGDCALFADPNNVHDIVNKINKLIRDPVLALKLGENGRNLVEKEYNWEIESNKLLQVYNKL